MSETISKLEEIARTIGRMKDEFAKALPGHMKAEKFTRVLQTYIKTSNARIDEARIETILAESLKAAQDGLYIDGREAALTTFKLKDGTTVAKYMPMMAGILKKVRNSGELASIMAEVIYENDQFDFEIDEDGKHIKHKPLFLGDRGKFHGVYAIARTKDGAKYIEVMNVADVEKIRNTSKTKNFGPWKDWFDEMAKKTVIRRLSKVLPMSTDIESVIRADDDLYDLNPRKPEEKGKEAGSPSRLQGLMGAQQEEPEPPANEQPPPKEPALTPEEVPL